MISEIFSALPQLSQAVFCQPWGIRPSYHTQVLVPLMLAARENPARFAGVNEERAKMRLAPIYAYDAKSGLAQLLVSGPIGKGLGLWSLYFGGCDLDQLSQALEELAALKPKALAMHFNSPGGIVAGTEEFAAEIRAFADNIAPVHAYTDTQCCSCAYWLAAAADTFTAAPSADIGSIGVYSALFDTSRFYKEKGVDVHLITHGAFKGQGYPGVPISPEYLDLVQQDVARCEQRFYAHVASRRGAQITTEAAAIAAAGVETTPADHASAIMQGQSWMAQDAPRALCDGFFNSRAKHLAAMHSALTSVK
jgi:ClpP class serine protease